MKKQYVLGLTGITEQARIRIYLPNMSQCLLNTYRKMKRKEEAKMSKAATVFKSCKQTDMK